MKVSFTVKAIMKERVIIGVVRVDFNINEGELILFEGSRVIIVPMRDIEYLRIEG